MNLQIEDDSRRTVALCIPGEGGYRGTSREQERACKRSFCIGEGSCSISNGSVFDPESDGTHDDSESDATDAAGHQPPPSAIRHPPRRYQSSGNCARSEWSIATGDHLGRSGFDLGHPICNFKPQARGIAS